MMSRQFYERIPNLYRPMMLMAAIVLIPALLLRILASAINPLDFFGLALGILVCILFCFLAFGTGDSLFLTVGSACMAVFAAITLVIATIYQHQNSIFFFSIELLCSVFLLCSSLISRHVKTRTWVKGLFFLPVVLTLASLALLEWSSFNGWFWGMLAVLLQAVFYAVAALCLVLKPSKPYSHALAIPAHLAAALFSFGVWELSWIYRRTAYLNRLSKQKRSSKRELLLCMFLPFYYPYWIYTSAKTIDRYTKDGENPTKLSVLCLLLSFLPFPLASVILQDHINELIEADEESNEVEDEENASFEGDGKNPFIQWFCVGLSACSVLLVAGLMILYMVVMPQWDYDAAVESGMYSVYINKYGIREFEVPDGVTEIKQSAFYQCTTLESVVLPDSVESIEASAFRASGIRKICIPARVESIGVYAFADCAALERVTMEEGVEEIGAYAFANCESLTHMIMAESVKTIEEGILAECEKLEFLSVPFVGETETSPTYALAYFFGGVGYMSNTDLVPSSLKTVALTNVECIFDDTFRGCKNLQAIALPVECREIYARAFFDSALNTIYYEGDVLAYMTIRVEAYMNATVKYYYSEEAPAVSGNYWHYVDGVPTVWENN